MANAKNHVVEWTTLPCDRPFDIIFVGVCSPGAILSLDGDTKCLNVTEGMIGLFTGAPLQIVNSCTVAQLMR
jgi:hypothetical protein